jgi:hypothetical protein
LISDERIILIERGFNALGSLLLADKAAKAPGKVHYRRQTQVFLHQAIIILFEGFKLQNESANL